MENRIRLCGLSAFNLVKMSVSVFGPLLCFHYISHTFPVRRMTMGFVRKSGYLHILLEDNWCAGIIFEARTRLVLVFNSVHFWGKQIDKFYLL